MWLLIEPASTAGPENRTGSSGRCTDAGVSRVMESPGAKLRGSWEWTHVDPATPLTRFAHAPPHVLTQGTYAVSTRPPFACSPGPSGQVLAHRKPSVGLAPPPTAAAPTLVPPHSLSRVLIGQMSLKGWGERCTRGGQNRRAEPTWSRAQGGKSDRKSDGDLDLHRNEGQKQPFSLVS